MPIKIVYLLSVSSVMYYEGKICLLTESKFDDQFYPSVNVILLVLNYINTYIYYGYILKS